MCVKKNAPFLTVFYQWFNPKQQMFITCFRKYLHKCFCVILLLNECFKNLRSEYFKLFSTNVPLSLRDC